MPPKSPSYINSVPSISSVLCTGNHTSASCHHEAHLFVVSISPHGLSWQPTGQDKTGPTTLHLYSSVAITPAYKVRQSICGFPLTSSHITREEPSIWALYWLGSLQQAGSSRSSNRRARRLDLLETSLWGRHIDLFFRCRIYIHAPALALFARLASLSWEKATLKETAHNLVGVPR